MNYDGNMNVLVIGGSGAGKTRYYVKPNVCQMNSDLFITGPRRATCCSTSATCSRTTVTRSARSTRSSPTARWSTTPSTTSGPISKSSPLRPAHLDDDPRLSRVRATRSGRNPRRCSIWRSSRSCETTARPAITISAACSSCCRWQRHRSPMRTSRVLSTSSSMRSETRHAPRQAQAEEPRSPGACGGEPDPARCPGGNHRLYGLGRRALRSRPIRLPPPLGQQASIRQHTQERQARLRPHRGLRPGETTASSSRQPARRSSRF